MKLRCSNCSKEKYEDEMVLDKETGHSKCECGCSTFTVLCNMEEIQ